MSDSLRLAFEESKMHGEDYWNWSFEPDDHTDPDSGGHMVAYCPHTDGQITAFRCDKDGNRLPEPEPAPPAPTVLPPGWDDDSGDIPF